MRRLALTTLFLLPLLLFACTGDEPAAEESAEAGDSEAAASPNYTTFELAPELRGSLAGRTAVIVVGNDYYDPELYGVLSLLNQAGAAVHTAAAETGVAYGLGGSDARIDLDLDELAVLIVTEGVELLYLMQSRGMERLGDEERLREVVRLQLETGGMLAASGIGLEALIGADVLEGVRVAPYRALYDECERAGAIVDEGAETLIDGDIASAVFWPQGPELVRKIIANTAGPSSSR